MSYLIFTIGLLAIYMFANAVIGHKGSACVHCGKLTNKAPCGCTVCRRCCDECYSLRKHCRYIKGELEGQVWD